MTDDFTPASVENQTSPTDNELREQVSVQPQDAVVEGEGEFGIFTPSATENESVNRFWQNLRKLFLPTPRERADHFAQRISRLSAAVELHPDSPTNFVLRGELYLEMGDYALAKDDFERALELAVSQTEIDDWGIVAQAVQDRAHDGLAEALRHTL